MPAPRIAFLLLAHQDPEHLERLCRRLAPHAVFVHWDGQGAPVAERLATLPNVTLITSDKRLHWGDFTIVAATLKLLRAARAQADFDRYVLLSGGCYPIKPMAAFEAALAAEPHREWIALTPIAAGSHLHALIARRWRMAPLIPHPGVDKQLRSLSNKLSKVIGRNLQAEIGMQPYFGSQWWALTGYCVDTMLTFVDQHPAFVRAYKSVYAPDEHFFQTIVGNSEFGVSGIAVPDAGAATNRSSPLQELALTKDRNFGNDQADFDLIAKTGKFFIRKVSTGRNGPLLDRIDRELLGVVDPTRQ